MKLVERKAYINLTEEEDEAIIMVARILNDLSLLINDVMTECEMINGDELFNFFYNNDMIQCTIEQ